MFTEDQGLCHQTVGKYPTKGRVEHCGRLTTPAARKERVLVRDFNHAGFERCLSYGRHLCD